MRRLAAILFMDVVGYSKRMSLDESGTLAKIKSFTDDDLKPLIAQHNGKLVKSLGDGWLVAFTNCHDAVSCSNSGVAITITFRDNSGDLPLMTADKTNLAFSGGTTALTVAQTTAGTKEFLECSGRGSCDRAKGQCKCFDGMQSSNGAGKRGLRADCGKQQLI